MTLLLVDDPLVARVDRILDDLIYLKLDVQTLLLPADEQAVDLALQGLQVLELSQRAPVVDVEGELVEVGVALFARCGRWGCHARGRVLRGVFDAVVERGHFLPEYVPVDLVGIVDVVGADVKDECEKDKHEAE